MTKLLTLEEWAKRNYEEPRPSQQTLWRWARNGKIYPAPEKHGREYRVREEAIYINPKSFSLARKLIQEKQIQSPLVERLIHGKEAGKI
ncbi:excisionase [Brenneria corticis]|uniref:Excisionase n=1 Tax=Brenneria corticis TaxID=2173106 RepID=A0A2U1TMA9_9GAMM|nr:excisionase [Brenneria sp. CFCC 11842]PWC10499.1 excisionase [Brenneria sp. CFCC 11842]